MLQEILMGLPNGLFWETYIAIFGKIEPDLKDLQDFYKEINQTLTDYQTELNSSDSRAIPDYAKKRRAIKAAITQLHQDYDEFDSSLRSSVDKVHKLCIAEAEAEEPRIITTDDVSYIVDATCNKLLVYIKQAKKNFQSYIPVEASIEKFSGIEYYEGISHEPLRPVRLDNYSEHGREHNRTLLGTLCVFMSGILKPRVEYKKIKTI